MLRITVEIVPFGSEGSKRKLAEVEVVNDGTGDKHLGNYDVRWNGINVGRVEDHWRAEGYLPLVKRVMEEL